MIEKTLTVPIQRKMESRTGEIAINTRSDDPIITIRRDDQLYEDGVKSSKTAHIISRLGSQVISESITLTDGTVITFQQLSEAVKRFCDKWDEEGGNRVSEGRRGPRSRP
jgi:hypothetical protein